MNSQEIVTLYLYKNSRGGLRDSDYIRYSEMKDITNYVRNLRRRHHITHFNTTDTLGPYFFFHSERHDQKIVFPIPFLVLRSPLILRPWRLRSIGIGLGLFLLITSQRIRGKKLSAVYFLFSSYMELTHAYCFVRHFVESLVLFEKFIINVLTGPKVK